MQTMNFQSVQPSMPNTAMPFMAAQIDAQKQMTFSSPLDHKVEKMADRLDVLTENMDKLAVSMNDLKDQGMVEIHPETETGHGQGEEISIDVILDKSTETGVTQEIGHGLEEETEGIEIMIDNTEVETEVEIIIEILETIGIETIKTQDQTEVIDQEAIIEKDTMVTITEGLTIVLDAVVIKVAIITRDLGIEVILMAEETQEEILHVLMIVFSPCKTQ